MRTGETFRVVDPEQSLDVHLWIVLSKPELDPAHILIANLTSWRSDKDQACVLLPGDHPFIRKKTCVNYADSKIVGEAKIEDLLRIGRLQKREPVAMPLLERIREGAMQSRFIPLDHGQLLIDQGLVAS